MAKETDIKHIWEVEETEFDQFSNEILPGFYFEDERNWFHENGPYPTKEEAEKALIEYQTNYL